MHTIVPPVSSMTLVVNSIQMVEGVKHHHGEGCKGLASEAAPFTPD